MVESVAAADEATAKNVCPAVLRRLRGEDVKGLSEWIARLNLPKYEEEATKWCQRHSVKDVPGILEKWEAFSDDLNLKRLEKSRVQKDAENSTSETAAKELSPAHASMLRNRIGTFGQPPYSIMEKKGSGGFAEVHRCLRVEDGELKTYAVKIQSLSRYRLLGE